MSSVPTNQLRISDIAAAVASSVLSALPVFLVAALAPEIRASLHFGVTAFGSVVALYYLSAALGSLPLSRLVEAVGATRALRGGGVVTAVLLLLVAVLARGVISLAVLMALAGLVSAAIQPATNLFLIRRIPAGRRGLAFGLKQAAVPLAVVLSGLAVPALALTLGWRWAFAIVAVLALAASTCMPRARTSLAAYRARPPIPSLSRRDLVYLVFLTFGFGLSVAAASALSTFAVTALTAAGQSHATSGLLTSLAGLAAATTRITVGAQADHRLRAHLVVISVMLLLGTLAYGLLAVATAALDSLLVPSLLFAFAAGWGWNGLFSLAIATRYPAQAARATAITSIGGRAGGVLGPFVFGVVITHASYTWAWLIAAAATASGALILLIGHYVVPSARPIFNR